VSRAQHRIYRRVQPSELPGRARCDRQSPCAACVKRGRPIECIYTSSLQERQVALDYSPHNRNRQARQSLARLELTTTQLREQMRVLAKQSLGLPEDVVSGDSLSLGGCLSSPLADRFGSLNLNDDHTVYSGSTHWITILEDEGYS
jgi:hypothetical protein